MLKNICQDHQIKNFKAEVGALKMFAHPNIIKILDFQEKARYTKRNGQVQVRTFIVLQYARGGCLFDYICQSRLPFSEKITRYYFHQLIEALEYCHSKKIAHRDLKPENLLFDENYQLKLADFGFSKPISSNEKLWSQLDSNLQAPEVFSQQPVNEQAVELFSAAVCLF